MKGRLPISSMHVPVLEQKGIEPSTSALRTSSTSAVASDPAVTRVAIGCDRMAARRGGKRGRLMQEERGVGNMEAARVARGKGAT